jgi:ribose-phosphate pyrophosphokinase
MDLHAPQIQGFFDVPVDHLDASSVFVPYIKSLNIEDLIIAAPDMGGVHRAREYAKYFNADMVICDKHRKRANEIESMTIIGDVEGKNVVLGR